MNNDAAMEATRMSGLRLRRIREAQGKSLEIAPAKLIRLPILAPA